MFFLFTGEERYLIDIQIDNWKNAFIKKYWLNNLYIFWEENFNAEQIQTLLMWWWLFEEKKLIIIKWLPKDSIIKISSWEYDKIESFLLNHFDNLSTDNVIAFVSYKPDKRTKLYKFLSKHSKIKLKEYKAFTEKKLINYLKETFNLSDTLSSYVISKLWTNLFYIHNELWKILKIYNKITKELIDKYVVVNIEQNSFSLLDNLQNPDNAIKIIDNLHHNQEDFFKILWLLYWNLKNIILILEQKNLWKNPKDISSILWIHPFVVWKIYKKYNFTEIFEKMFKKLIDLDYKIKTWKIDYKLSYLYLKKVILDCNESK